MSFAETVTKAEAEFNLGKGGGKFKLKEGDNRVRIMSDCAPIQNTYNGKSSVKFLTFVWDYAAKQLKLAFFPHTIAKKIADLEINDDFKFSSFPMPYDLEIRAKNAGTIDVEYTVLPARKDSPVPPEALEALAKEKPVTEVRDLIASEQAKKDAVPVAEAPQEDIPFFGDEEIRAEEIPL
jgi:hypothetical protein